MAKYLGLTSPVLMSHVILKVTWISVTSRRKRQSRPEIISLPRLSVYRLPPIVPILRRHAPLRIHLHLLHMEAVESLQWVRWLILRTGPAAVTRPQPLLVGQSFGRAIRRKRRRSRAFARKTSVILPIFSTRLMSDGIRTTVSRTTCTTRSPWMKASRTSFVPPVRILAT